MIAYQKNQILMIINIEDEAKIINNKQNTSYLDFEEYVVIVAGFAFHKAKDMLIRDRYWFMNRFINHHFDFKVTNIELSEDIVNFAFFYFKNTDTETLVYQTLECLNITLSFLIQTHLKLINCHYLNSSCLLKLGNTRVAFELALVIISQHAEPVPLHEGLHSAFINDVT